MSYFQLALHTSLVRDAVDGKLATVWDADHYLSFIRGQASKLEGEDRIRFWSSDAPAVAKSFFAYEPLNVVQRRWRDEIKLLIGLSTPFGDLYDTMCPNVVALIRQLLLVYKRWEVKSTQEQKEAAYARFIEVDGELEDPVGDWSDPDRLVDLVANVGPNALTRVRVAGAVYRAPHTFGTGVSGTLTAVAARVFTAIGPISHSLDRARHGPGAVSDTRGDKYIFPHWPDRLDAVFPYDKYGTTGFTALLDIADDDRQPLSTEPAAKLTIVPKDLDSWRTIVVTPAALQYGQQAVREQLVSRTRSTWLRDFVSFDDQVPNQDMALNASSTGRLATVDLKEASDRVSLRLVERLCCSNPDLLRVLCGVRSRLVRVGSDGTILTLRKLASMGDATTFPMQTLVFLTLAISSTLDAMGLAPTQRNIKKLRRSVRVFGDDILIPSVAMKTLAATLTLYGLKVNSRKSFWTGKFRESCGLDAFAGYNVTPAYAKSGTPTGLNHEVISALELSNLLHRKGWWRAAEYVTHQLPGHFHVPVVKSSSGEFGLVSFASATHEHLKRRWSRRYQAWEYRAHEVFVPCVGLQTKGWFRLHRHFDGAGCDSLPDTLGNRIAHLFPLVGKPGSQPIRQTPKIRANWRCRYATKL